MNLTEELRKPYYCELSVIYWLKRSVIFGVFVFGFLYLFRPFQIENVNGNFLLICAAFGSITTSAMLLLNAVILPFALRFLNPENWTVGKSISWTLVNICCIGILNAVYFSLTFLGGLHFMNIIWFLGVTLLISIFPVSLTVILGERKANEKYVAESSEITDAVREKQNKVLNEQQIVQIKSKNAGEDIRVELNKLLYMQSADNYMLVYFLGESQLEKVMIRNTLSQVAADLKDFSEIFFCHRSYLINLNQVVSVSGNAQGFKLKLKGVERLIPVSRKHNDFVRTYFRNVRR